MAGQQGAPAAVRILVLGLLCAQNSLYTLLRRYSRGVLKESVSSSTVLLAGELLKFAVSATFFLTSEAQAVQTDFVKVAARSASAKKPNAFVLGAFSRIRAELGGSLSMTVPALTYLVMNMLSFKALEYIDATVFSMVAQLKILSTAGFSSVILGRRLACMQWRAIAVLTLAVTAITYERGSQQRDASTALLNTPFVFSPGYLVGISMVALEVALSGLIGAYFEKHLKNGKSSVWGRNLQLSFWSILIYGAIEVLVSRRPGDPPTHSDADRAIGRFSFVTVMVVMLGGAGGLLVAFAIKHADAVLKSMAASFSLVVVVAAEILFLGARADPIVIISCGIALLGLQIYQDAASPAAGSSSTGYAVVSTTGSGSSEAVQGRAIGTTYSGSTPEVLSQLPDTACTARRSEGPSMPPCALIGIPSRTRS